MNPIEIAARNYVANTTGAPLEVVNTLFATNPAFAEQSFNVVASMIHGPYGTLASIEDSVDETDVAYVDALDDVVELIDGFVMQVPCECAAVSVHAALQSLKAGIDVLAEEVIGDEDQQLELPFSIENFLSALLGGNVQFVALEPSEG